MQLGRGLTLGGTVDQRGFQDVDSVSSLVQGGYGIDVEIHTERMTELIGDELRIDAGLSGETRVSAAHDLK